jgi:hypothetical protein
MVVVSIAMVLVSLISCSSAQVASNYPILPPANWWTSGPNNGQTFSGYEEKNTTFDFEQSVQGNGYFMTYLYAKSGNIAVKNYAHGSGSLNSEATLTYQYWDKKNHPNYADYNDFTQNCIQFKEDVAMVYAPMKIAVGTGYYAANPLEYASLLKEKTWVKNYRAGTSMHHEVEYAHALDKELNIDVKEKFNYTYDPIWEGVGYTRMSVVEDVTDGKAHIGVLQANENYANQLGSVNNLMDPKVAGAGKKLFSSAWNDPAIEIDEDYWGTYHIEKNMTLEVPYYKKTTLDDWLPCCFGGFGTMTVADKRPFKSSAGVFDCTCYKAPTQAQFPRVY